MHMNEAGHVALTFDSAVHDHNVHVLLWDEQYLTWLGL